MPTISMFYGILVSIFFEDADRHHLPPSTCAMPGKRRPSPSRTAASWPAACLANNSNWCRPWIEIHKDELFADWELAANGEQPFPIEPLR